MAIAFTNHGASTGTTEVNPDLRDVGDATSYSNTAWTPPTEGLLLAFVVSGQNTVTDHSVDSFTGNGVTWTQIATVVFQGAGTRRVTLFAANAAGSSNGANTVGFGTDTQILCYVSIFSATGVDLSGGVSGAFVQSPTDSGAAEASGAVTLGAAGHADNRPVSFFAHNANEAVTADGAWTAVDDFTGAGPTMGAMSQWKSDAFSTSAAASWASSVDWGGIAAELKATVAGGPEKQTLYTSRRRTVAR